MITLYGYATLGEKCIYFPSKRTIKNAHFLWAGSEYIQLDPLGLGQRGTGCMEPKKIIMPHSRSNLSLYRFDIEV